MKYRAARSCVALVAMLAWTSLAPPMAARQATLGEATAAFAGGASTTGWLPVALHRDRYLYATGALNGVSTDVVIDSGAGATVIDESFARELGLKLESGVQARGVGGTVAAKLTRNVRLQLGALTVSLPAVVVIDLSGIRRQLGRGMPVVAGQDVFRRVVIDVDYAQRRVACHAPTTFVPGPEFHTAALHADGGRYRVDAQLEQRPSARFELDTGSADALIVFAPYAQEHALLVDRRPLSTRQIGGVGGASIAKLGTVRRFAIGGETLADVPTVFHDGRTGALATDSAAGLIGAGLLRRFRVVFDVAQHQLHLAATTDRAAPFVKDRLGLQVVLDSRELRVVHVALGSPAALAGWTVSDRVAAVNGAPVPADFWAWWQEAASAPAGRTVELRDGRGKTRPVVLADYY